MLSKTAETKKNTSKKRGNTSILSVPHKHIRQVFRFSISGIKRMRAVVSPPVQMNADLSTTARALFSSLSRYRLTDSPSYVIRIKPQERPPGLLENSVRFPLPMPVEPVPLLCLCQSCLVSAAALAPPPPPPEPPPHLPFPRRTLLLREVSPPLARAWVPEAAPPLLPP